MQFSIPNSLTSSLSQVKLGPIHVQSRKLQRLAIPGMGVSDTGGVRGDMSDGIICQLICPSLPSLAELSTSLLPAEMTKDSYNLGAYFLIMLNDIVYSILFNHK